ncbi:MAG: hypothetical protein CMI00_15680 [Oceanospirillaceae bacterium]|nr:hypothetical protein [Oceanospirillaceae bacterium]MAR01963.1 hypothetical protein [Oceanospirillaceae bacterium]|tara:strand:+ start:1739 stop:2167 length:429 start_codon:yes stop_codon:yes gene_type:complete
MRMIRFKTCLAFLALLAFASESFAGVPFPCDHRQNTAVMADSAAVMMDHRHHASAASPDAVPASHHMAHQTLSGASRTLDTPMSCCDHDQCSAMDCVSVVAVAVVTPAQILGLNPAPVLNTRYTLAYLSQESGSLFRPPISR